MSVNKSIPFAAPYTSTTFDANNALLVGKNGVVTGGAVTTSGSTATIQPLTFIQNGLFVSASTTLSVSIPVSLTAPYFIAVSSSSTVEIPSEIITPVFIKRPEDVSANAVLVAQWDGAEWVSLPKLQIDEIINAINKRSLTQDFKGIADGFDVSVVGSNLDATPGTLIDQQGQTFTKTLSSSFPIIAADFNGLDRADQLIFRRPDDSPNRGGILKYIVGDTYKSDGSFTLYDATAIGSASKVDQAPKVVVDPATNISYMFWIEDYGARARIAMAVVGNDMSSVTSNGYVSSAGVTDFDVILNSVGNFDLIISKGITLTYTRVSTTGSVVFAESTVVTDTVQLTDPKIVSIASGSTYYLHVIYRQVTTSLVQKLYYLRLNGADAIATNPVLLVDITDKIQTPTIAKDDDDSLLFLTYANFSTGRIYLRTYDAGTPTISAPPTQIGTTLELEDDTFYLTTQAVLASGGSSQPIVKRADNKDTFVFWLQDKGAGNYGIGVYSPRFLAQYGHLSIMVDLTGPSENIAAFDVDIDGMSSAHFILSLAGALTKATLRIDDATAGPTGTVNGTSGNEQRIKFNARGALIHTYSFASSGFTNNGAVITPVRYGAGLIGSHAVASNEIAFTDASVLTLPSFPTVGDQIVVTGSASNNGTYTILSFRSFIDTGVTYDVFMVSATLTPELGGGSTDQFQTQAATQGQFVKSSAASLPSFRNFFVTPTDIQITYLRRSDLVLAAAGPAIEETPSISRLYEFMNILAGGGGEATWQVASANILTIATDFTVQFFNRVSAYTITAFPAGILIPVGSVMYVVVPDTDTPATLTPIVVPFGSGILDRYGRRAVPLFWNIAGYLYTKFAPFKIVSGDTVILGNSLSPQFLSWLGASSNVPDPTNHAYSSTNYITQSTSINAAIGDLDAAIGSFASTPALPTIGTPSGASISTDLTAIDETFRTPLRLYASQPATAVLNIAASEVQLYNGTGKSTSPQSNLVPSTPLSTVNFQTNATTGATFSITFPSATTGYFVRVGFAIQSNSTIIATFSPAVASFGALADPGTLFPTGTPMGWVDLQNTGGTTYKTANSSSNIIENEVSSVSTIHNFGSGGGGSGGASANYAKDIFQGDSTTATFNLSFTPKLNSLAASRNGLDQIEGAAYDYTLSGTLVTFASIPSDTDRWYFKYPY